jgi:hypothetical protein
MHDLDVWLDALNPIEGAKWQLSSATGINDQGLIVGEGTYNDGPGGLADGNRGFVLDASALILPEPASLGAMLIMTALLPRRSRPAGPAFHAPR